MRIDLTAAADTNAMRRFAIDLFTLDAVDQNRVAATNLVTCMQHASLGYALTVDERAVGTVQVRDVPAAAVWRQFRVSP